MLAANEALLAELRRALIKGQLKQAEDIAAKLSEDERNRTGSADASPLPAGLLEGIAMILAGGLAGRA